MSFALLLLAITQDLPDELTLEVGEVEKVGKNVVLVLRKRSVRAETYRFFVQTPEGRKRAVPLPVRTYRGHVQGDTAMRVNAVLETGGFLSANFSEGRDIVDQVIRRKVAVPGGACTPWMSSGNRVVPLSSVSRRVSPTSGGHAVPLVPMRLHRIAVTAVKEHVDACAGLEDAVSRAEQRINDCDFTWARNVGVAWEIDTLLIETSSSDPAGVTWMDDTPEDSNAKVHTVIFCAAGNGCRGGLVASAGLGPSAGGLMHEGGHSFGCPHGLDINDAMKGNHAFFGPNNTRVIVNTLKLRPESAAPAVVYHGALPPQAQDDVAETPKDTPATIDVLDNDFDGNGDALLLKCVGPCRKGGRVTLSPDLRKAVYTPPPGFLGVDSFRYEVEDGTGTSSRAGKVDVNVFTDGVAAHFDFDGLGKGPAGGRGNAGHVFRNAGPVGDPAVALFFEPLLVPGVRGKAVFNGINSGWGPARTYDWMHQINIPNLGDPGPGDLGVSIWVLYPRFIQNMMPPHKKNISSNSGVIIGKGGIKYTGDPNGPYGTGWAIIHLPHYRGFKFLGANGAGSFDVKTSEPIRLHTWYHLAMSLDRKAQRVRAWVNGKEATETGSTPDLLPGDISDGQELRLYNGHVWQWWHSYPIVIDELKLYTRALSPAMVAELYAEGKDAQAPDVSAFLKEAKLETPVKGAESYEERPYVRPEEYEPEGSKK
jgi:hypothetical protein